jgi:Rho-binding antiterminator
MDTPYTPIACALHDRLELAALRGREVTVNHSAADGPRASRIRILDIRVRDGEEWLVTEPPVEIRLDHILSLDGEPSAEGC